MWSPYRSRKLKFTIDSRNEWTNTASTAYHEFMVTQGISMLGKSAEFETQSIFVTNLVVATAYNVNKVPET